jgi:hypothetical protein
MCDLRSACGVTAFDSRQRHTCILQMWPALCYIMQP